MTHDIGYYNLRPEVTLSALKEELNTLLGQLRDETQLRREAEEEISGFSELKRGVLDDAVVLKQASAGMDAVTAAILVAIAPAAADVATQIILDLWEVILLPRLEQRFGGGSIQRVEQP